MLVARAVDRWDLTLDQPFATGMAAWTDPATTSAGTDVVVKLSYLHLEARDEHTDCGHERSVTWRLIDPKPVHGDLAWDPWPLPTQIGTWTTEVPRPGELAERTRLVADVTGLDPSRIAAWCVARGVESAWWAADHGWWTGFRGADGDLARSTAWAAALDALGG